jgi:hypothetical protein
MTQNVQDMVSVKQTEEEGMETDDDEREVAARQGAIRDNNQEQSTTAANAEPAEDDDMYCDAPESNLATSQAAMRATEEEQSAPAAAAAADQADHRTMELDDLGTEVAPRQAPSPASREASPERLSFARERLLSMVNQLILKTSGPESLVRFASCPTQCT